MSAVKQKAEDVDWDRLDKQKFFVLGAGMFSVGGGMQWSCSCC